MKLEVLVGMIASGKSTYARQRADQGALVVCHDELTTMLHATRRYEPGLRDCYRNMEHSLAWSALLTGLDVVIDRTHLTFESRERWIKWVRRRNAANGCDGNSLATHVIAVVFPSMAPGTHAQRRFDHDSRGRTLEDWIKVAEHHAGQYRLEPITESEGFTRIVHMPGVLDPKGTA
jgi:hypothetical protein